MAGEPGAAAARLDGVYPPEHERRLRLHLPEFEAATKEASQPGSLIDITTSFEEWMAGHEYRDAYFEDPELLETALPAFFDHLVARCARELDEHADPTASSGCSGPARCSAWATR